MTERHVRIAKALTLAALAAFAGLVAVIVSLRLAYPHELEWTTGAMLDHVERAREGRPLYVAPSLEWTPFLYPPGWYWVCALASRVLPEALACRLVSIASSAASAVLAFHLARRLGATRFGAWAAALLFVSCFGFTLEWYDIERSDMLFAALLAGSCAALLASERLAAAAVAGALLGCALFVKQPATTFLLLVPLVLALTGRARRAGALLAGAALAMAPLAALAARGEARWLWFYCVKLPAAHGVEPKYATLFFVSDVSRAFALTLATAAALAFAARRRRAADAWRLVSFAAYLAAGFLAAASSRMHLGGWPNVLVFWTVFACPAAGWALSEIERGARREALAGAAAAVALQAGAFAPDPNEAIPGKADADGAAALAARVRELERGGEVVVLGRGHLTARRHAHHNALLDAVRAGQAFPADLTDGLAQRAFAAFVLDDPKAWDPRTMLPIERDLIVLVGRRYFVAERLDDRAPMPVVGYPTEPRWVFRPREAPLEGADDAVWSRLVVEAGFAERNLRAWQAGGARDDGLGIEREASRGLR